MQNFKSQGIGVYSENPPTLQLPAFKLNAENVDLDAVLEEHDILDSVDLERYETRFTLSGVAYHASVDSDIEGDDVDKMIAYLTVTCPKGSELTPMSDADIEAFTGASYSLDGPGPCP